MSPVLNELTNLSGSCIVGQNSQNNNHFSQCYMDGFILNDDLFFSLYKLFQS